MKRSRRKRLGQHFLVDHSVAQRIAGLLAEQPPRVLEIGPGQGALTVPLLARCERVLALEVDSYLIPELERRCAGSGLELRVADALKEPLAPLLAAEAPWQVAANLPYSVGTAILRRLLPQHELLTRLVVMLQREVVERLVAVPGTREHGLLALERAAHATARVAFHVPPAAFRPRPRVASSVVVLELQAPAHDPQDLARALAMAAGALTNRRKMLSNALKSVLTPAQIVAAGIDPEARPGTISLAGWIQLAKSSGLPPDPR